MIPVSEDKASSMSNITQSNTVSIYATLKNMFRRAIMAAYPNAIKSPILVTTKNNSHFGDYYCNSALPLLQELSLLGKKFFSILFYKMDIYIIIILYTCTLDTYSKHNYCVLL